MSETGKSVCEPQNFNLLFERHSETLRNFLFYTSGDLQQAEDLTQEAFLTLWRNCRKVIFEKAKSYLYTVAKNKFFNEAAHQKVILKYQKSITAYPTENESPHFKMEEQEFLKKIQTAIQELPDGQREAFLLNRIDKKTYKEISELLGISETAVEKRIQKALIKMRVVIKNI